MAWLIRSVSEPENSLGEIGEEVAAESGAGRGGAPSSCALAAAHMEAHTRTIPMNVRIAGGLISALVLSLEAVFHPIKTQL